MERSTDRTLTGCQLVQLGVFQIKISLTHRALHVGDGMTHHAAQPGLRLGTVYDLFDGSVHQSAVEHGRIVAPSAPLGRFGADRILHVLNALAVPLVVEGRKVVHRTEPLVVDVLVAALAGVGLHEILAGNFLSAIDLGGTGEEGALRASPSSFMVAGGMEGFSI